MSAMSRREVCGRGILREQQTGDFLARPRRRKFERFVDVDIAWVTPRAA